MRLQKLAHVVVDFTLWVSDNYGFFALDGLENRCAHIAKALAGTRRADQDQIPVCPLLIRQRDDFLPVLRELSEDRAACLLYRADLIYLLCLLLIHPFRRAVSALGADCNAPFILSFCAEQVVVPLADECEDKKNNGRKDGVE